MIDMSPVCLATDSCGGGLAMDEETTAAAMRDSASEDSSEEYSDVSSTGGGSTELPRDENICRGRMGPGLWHCYAVVFDAETSVIRVDGLEEQIENQSCGNGVLDGLTLGSDHCFQMSLCFGGGDADEGEGTISEFVVFKGRLSTCDIERMENHLMKKHGIAPASSVPAPVKDKECLPDNDEDKQQPSACTWQEDEWKRQVHALIVQPAPWKLQGKGVPLRVAARHRSVAWQRVSSVTGQVVKVPRIGCKWGNGSSDW